MDMGARGTFVTTAKETISGLRTLSADALEREAQLHALYAGNTLAMLGKRAPACLLQADAAGAAGDGAAQHTQRPASSL